MIYSMDPAGGAGRRWGGWYRKDKWSRWERLAEAGSREECMMRLRLVLRGRPDAPAITDGVCQAYMGRGNTPIVGPRSVGPPRGLPPGEILVTQVPDPNDPEARPERPARHS